MSNQVSCSQSDILPAVMLAMLLAVTGLETAFLLVAPHRVNAHPVRALAMMDARHMPAAN